MGFTGEGKTTSAHFLSGNILNVTEPDDENECQLNIQPLNKDGDTRKIIGFS